MKEDNKKKQISEWALSDIVKTNVNVDDILNQTLEENFRHIYSILELKDKIKYQNSLIEIKKVESTNRDLIRIEKYIKDEIVIFETDLLPLNYYKLESYRYYSEIKNRIINSISEKLLELNVNDKGEIINSWSNSFLILQLHRNGSARDLDNYFSKPYVDGIRNSRFIIDDSSNNLDILYSNLSSSSNLLRAILINKKHIDKYKNLVFDAISNYKVG